MKKFLFILFLLFSFEAKANGARVVAGGGFDNPSVWEYCIDGTAYIAQTFNATAGGITPKLNSQGKAVSCSY